MPPSEVMTYDPPKVIGGADDDPDGVIPPSLLLTGIDVVIPIWPLQSPPGREDTLIVQTRRGIAVEFNWSQVYPTPISDLEFIVRIGPEYLAVDGVIELGYQTRNYLSNPANSIPRNLTIDHMPVVRDLPEIKFPAASIWGYLNCATQPPIWTGIELKVPPLPTFVRSGDTCTVEWVGYLSLNGSGSPIQSTYKEITRKPLTNTDISNGFSEMVAPFVPHVQPMINKASAIATYSIYRGTKLIGKSKDGLVKIDRTVSGEDLPCGP